MPINHTVKAGESTTSIADIYGFFPDSIWSDAANSTLKLKRKDMNILQAGDLLVIPDKQPKTVTIGPNSKHTFRRLGVPALFKLRIKGPNNQPITNTPYRLEIDGKITNGQLSAEGELEQTINPNAKKAKLYLGEAGNEIQCKIQLGHLDPSDSICGLQARLNNLGYYAGNINGQLNKHTKAALIKFQQDIGHPSPTGEIDQQTIDKIEQLHEK